MTPAELLQLEITSSLLSAEVSHRRHGMYLAHERWDDLDDDTRAVAIDCVRRGGWHPRYADSWPRIYRAAREAS